MLDRLKMKMKGTFKNNATQKYGHISLQQEDPQEDLKRDEWEVFENGTGNVSVLTTF